jgi:hypothetical protein
MCGRYCENVVSAATAVKPAPIVLAGHGVNRKSALLSPQIKCSLNARDRGSEEVVLRANQLPDNALRTFVDDWRR